MHGYPVNTNVHLLCHSHTQWPTWRQSTPLPTPPPSHGTNLLTTTECSYMEKQQTTYLSLGSYNWLMWQDRPHTLYKRWTHSETTALVYIWNPIWDREAVQQWPFRHLEEVRVKRIPQSVCVKVIWVHKWVKCNLVNTIWNNTQSHSYLRVFA